MVVTVGVAALIRFSFIGEVGRVSGPLAGLTGEANTVAITTSCGAGHDVCPLSVRENLGLAPLWLPSVVMPPFHFWGVFAWLAGGGMVG